MPSSRPIDPRRKGARAAKCPRLETRIKGKGETIQLTAISLENVVAQNLRVTGDEFWKIVARVAAQSSDELFWKGVALLAKTRGADIVGQFRKPSDSSRLKPARPRTRKARIAAVENQIVEELKKSAAEQAELETGVFKMIVRAGPDPPPVLGADPGFDPPAVVTADANFDPRRMDAKFYITGEPPDPDRDDVIHPCDLEAARGSKGGTSDGTAVPPDDGAA